MVLKACSESIFEKRSETLPPPPSLHVTNNVFVRRKTRPDSPCGKKNLAFYYPYIAVSVRSHTGNKIITTRGYRSLRQLRPCVRRVYIIIIYCGNRHRECLPVASSATRRYLHTCNTLPGNIFIQDDVNIPQFFDKVFFSFVPRDDAFFRRIRSPP